MVPYQIYKVLKVLIIFIIIVYQHHFGSTNSLIHFIVKPGKERKEVGSMDGSQ